MALTRGGCMIRLADEADADAISKLNEELFIVLNELKGDIYNPVAFPKYFIDSMIKSHESDYILIEDDNKVVGYALIEQRESPYTEYSAFVEDHFAYIYELVVLPEYRDKGYGKQIVKEAEKWAKDRGLSSIELNCLSNNYDAKAFYEKTGFGEYQVKLRKNVE
jgi:ribosomal protein S18 acetylase RimI-like enzyme